MKNRVVITGVGPITPIGIGKEKFFEGLKTGKNGIEKITQFDATNFVSQIAGEVPDFQPEDFIDKKELKRMDRFNQFAVVAARLAAEDAKIDFDKENRERVGVFIGSAIGGMHTLHAQYEKLFEKGPSRVSPFFVPMMISNMSAGHVAIDFKIHGPSTCNVTASASFVTAKRTSCLPAARRLQFLRSSSPDSAR